MGWHQFCHHRNWQKRTNGMYQKMNALIKVCQSHPNLFRKSPVFKWSDRHVCPDCSVLRMMGGADTRDEGLTLLLRPLSGLELHLNTLISILCEEISWVRLGICVYLSILWRPCGFLFCFTWFWRVDTESVWFPPWVCREKPTTALGYSKFSALPSGMRWESGCNLRKPSCGIQML